MTRWTPRRRWAVVTEPRARCDGLPDAAGPSPPDTGWRRGPQAAQGRVAPPLRLVLTDVDVGCHVTLRRPLPADDAELVGLEDLALDPGLPELRDRGVPQEHRRRLTHQDVFRLAVGGAPLRVARTRVALGHQLIVLGVAPGVTPPTLVDVHVVAGVVIV